MRLNNFCYVVIAQTIFAATLIDATRHKRSLSQIKKFLASTFIGNNLEKCTESYRQLETHRGDDIFKIPTQRYLDTIQINTISAKNSNIQDIAKEITEKSTTGFLTHLLRYLLRSGTLDETSKLIEGLLSEFQTEIGVKEEVEKQTMVRVPKKPSMSYVTDKFNTEFIYEAPFRQELSSIISFPSKYEYRQVKGDTVETFLVDENSDVKVTESIKPVPPRSAYIDDRIKQVILGVLSPKNPMDSVHSNIVNLQQSKKPSEAFLNDMNIKNELGNTKAIQKGANKNMKSHSSYKTYNHNPALFNYLNHFNKEINDIPLEFTEEYPQINNVDSGKYTTDIQFSSEYLNSNLRNKFNTLSSIETAMQTNPEHIRLPINYDYIPRNDSMKELSNKEIVNADLQTRYVYKQITGDKEFKYENSQNIDINQKGDKVDSSSDNISTYYNGRPIIVGSSNGKFEVGRSTSSEHLAKNIENLRGDIPES